MADSTNPTSPKVWAATAASVIIPVALALVGVLADAITNGTLTVPAPWGPVIISVLTVAGVFLAGHRTVDPRRVTGLSQAQVDEINAPITD